MSDASEPGVLYTDYAALAASTPAAALWSYRSHARERGRSSVTLMDQTVPLEEFWGRAEVEELLESLSHLGAPGCVAALRDRLLARVARFQRLVQVLLATDVSDWASVSSAVGFYDQAHMVNEFRAFAGTPPTVFFQPHDSTIVPAGGPLRGRPSEWACWSEVASP